MSKQLFFQCEVLNNQDPLMLGRVRARLISDNYQDMIKSFDRPPWNEQKDPWTERDPFVFNPLLPYFIYQVPQVGELINVLYYNSDFQYRNQYYVQATYSTPTTSNFEYYVGGLKFNGWGVQFTNPKPIKNADGSYENNTSKGVFPEPGDNSILGRGNSDVVVKPNGVLIRSNKYKGELIPNVLPVANNKGGFLHLEKFDFTKTKDKKKTYTELIEDIVVCKYLIEYSIINPENEQNSYTGFVFLYKLRPDQKVNSQELKVDSNVDNLKSLIVSEPFRALTLDQTAEFINGFINEINSKNKFKGRELFTDESINKFPIFYRPAPDFYKLVSSNPSPTTTNISYLFANKLYNRIKLNVETPNSGYGLIYAQNKVGLPYKLNRTNIQSYKYPNNPQTFGSFAADKVFLLSQVSSIPGKGVINFDGTVYGISADKYIKEIIPKTSSSVRGEELMELLNLIVSFLLTHTHNYPMLPPNPKSYAGVTAEDVLTEIQNATNKILNANIRLN